MVAAHPDDASFHHAVRERILAGLERAGHRVALIDLYAEGFEARLSAEELATHATGVADRPAIADHAAALGRADALVLVYPTWWGGQPAILKGWFDRVLCEGVAYTLPPGATRIRARLRHIRHLVVVTTYGAPRWVNLLEGEGGRRTVRWGVRTLLHWRARVRWLGCYALDTAPPDARRRFLDRVERELAGLGRPSRPWRRRRRETR